MNHLAATTDNPDAIGQVYNTACGEQKSLKELAENLRSLLTSYNDEIAKVDIKFGPERLGDIPHSLASIEKAQKLLGYQPQFDVDKGLIEAIDWYWTHL